MFAALRMRITLATAAVVLCAVASICLLSNVLLQKQFERYAADQQGLRMQDIADNLAMLYYPVTKTWDVDAIHALGMYSMTDGYILVVKDAEGAVVWDAQNHDMTRCSEVMGEITARMDAHGADGGFSAHELALTQNGNAIGAVTVTAYGPFFFSEADAALLTALNRILLVVGLVALVGAVVLGTTLANRLANDLAKQQEARKRRAEALAHELRTPLAALSVQLETMQETPETATPDRLAASRAELDRLTEQIEQLADIDAPKL